MDGTGRRNAAPGDVRPDPHASAPVESSPEVAVVESPREYTARLHALVGDQDPWAILAATHAFVRPLVVPGVSTWDIDKQAEEFIRSHGTATGGIAGEYQYTLNGAATERFGCGHVAQPITDTPTPGEVDAEPLGGLPMECRPGLAARATFARLMGAMKDRIDARALLAQLPRHLGLDSAKRLLSEEASTDA